MRADPSKYIYKPWPNAQEMHEHSKEWFSILSFVKDEQQILTYMIHFFINKTLNKKELMRLYDFEKSLDESRLWLNSLYKQVQKHMNQLEIILDDVCQKNMEQAYFKTHREFFMTINNYLLDYKAVKERGFVKLSSILKEEKSKKQ